MAGGFGTSTWGGISVTTQLLDAVPLGPRLVAAKLEGEPLQSSQYVVGDALCVNTWTITRPDRVSPLFITGVHKVSGTEFRLQLADTLGDDSVTHTLSAQQLRSKSGLLAVYPRDITFAGPPYQAVVPSPTIADPIDLKGQSSYQNGAPGGLSVGADGDYDEESGAPLIRKLILRRLLTPKGAFYHLPNYGFGLRPKMFLRPSQLQLLKSAMREEIVRERGVANADLSLRLSREGVLTVSITVALQKPNILVPVVFSMTPAGTVV